MRLLILNIILVQSVLGTNFIDLGNLEIEGELRRPAINLFTNTEAAKDNLHSFIIRKLESEFSDFNIDINSNEIEEFNNFEIELLDI